MTLRIFKRLSRGHDGNVVIEMAVIAPVLVFMALGAFDFGMAYSVQTSYEAAVRAGYEYAFIDSSSLTAVKSRVLANLDASTLEPDYPQVTEVCECTDGTSVSCTSTCSGVAPNHYVDVKVRGKHTLAFDWPFLADNAVYLERDGRVQVK